MLAARPNLPPFSYNGRTYVQIAWPVGTVCNEQGYFVGFAMPEVDIQESTELGHIFYKAMRIRKGIPDFYGAHVLLAANLAALLAEVHGLGHYMINVNPINMRFYPRAWYMAILDTDGFSINGHRRRYPARYFTSDYIAPESRGKAPQMLGLEQDLFALATIIFQLMNNGIHPFHGIDLHNNQPTTLQERIFAGLYAYGLTPSLQVRPLQQSIHECLEHVTRRLFDRAFLSTDMRPTAIEWRDHLRNLFTNEVLVQCKAPLVGQEEVKPVVFISYAKEDIVFVRQLCAYLKSSGFLTWFDEENIQPGRKWKRVIQEAIRSAHFLIFCLSKKAVTKRGFIHQEQKWALEAADLMPDNGIFLIPARIEECDVPSSVQEYQYIDLYVEGSKEKLAKYIAEEWIKRRGYIGMKGVV